VPRKHPSEGTPYHDNIDKEGGNKDIKTELDFSLHFLGWEQRRRIVGLLPLRSPSDENGAEIGSFTA